MSYITIGLNHKSAPIQIRERFALDHSRAQTVLRQLIQQPAINEAVVIATCNRTEIVTHSTDPNSPLRCLQHYFNDELGDFTYTLQGIHSVRHLMRVTAGLDSMLLGEPQIGGQVKSAYRLARETGTVGCHLNQLFPAAFATCKQVRSQTLLGKNPVSLAYVSTHLIKQIFTSIHQCQVLLVGAGNTIELVAAHLHRQQVASMTIANRTVAHAEEIANLFQAAIIPITQINEFLAKVDVVICAAASPLPLLGKGMVETALKQNKRRPLLMIDLGMPRNIEPEVSDLEDVYLYNVDDLQTIITQNLKHREIAAEQAEALIALQADHYMRQLRILEVKDLICRYRERLYTLRDEELERALRWHNQGKPMEQVLRQFADSLLNKVMHAPTVKIRDAAYHEQLEQLLIMKELLNL